jgi:phosphate:Na+ symporter
MILTVLGGIALFLLGMLMMTEGLKALAGSSLNRILAKFTDRPIKGVLSGALVTALVQSSSATTLMTIGFVSAGLLTFKQTMGLILGINLGTTSTGWIVSQLGFNVSISALAFPLLALGTVGKLFGEGKLSHAASALAGFGLIFIGISTIQTGMADIAMQYDPSSFPRAGLIGSLLLVLIGFGMTVVLQSSSAALATTLTALFAGAITFEQAAALVIGQNVGTTVKAGIAALGSTVPARQTAVAHITFNLVTATIALISLPFLVNSIDHFGDRFGWRETTTLAAFHTSFNVLGVLIFLPFAGPFSSLVQRFYPDRAPRSTRNLNPKLIPMYSAAVEAARRAALDIATGLVEMVHQSLHSKIKQKSANDSLLAAKLSLGETRLFLSEIRPEGGVRLDQQRHASVLHALDHLAQLRDALKEVHLAEIAGQSQTCADAYRETVCAIQDAIGLIVSGDLEKASEGLAVKSQLIADIRRGQRKEVLDNTAIYKLSPERALLELNALRWLDRVTYHIWRITHHLSPNGHPTDDEQDEELVIVD